MTPKRLITIGLAWLLAVVLWVRYFDRDLAFTWVAPSLAKQVALLAGIYLLICLYVIFLIGWLAPLGYGTYRLLRHR